MTHSVSPPTQDKQSTKRFRSQFLSLVAWMAPRITSDISLPSNIDDIQSISCTIFYACYCEFHFASSYKFRQSMKMHNFKIMTYTKNTLNMEETVLSCTSIRIWFQIRSDSECLVAIAVGMPRPCQIITSGILLTLK